MLEINVLDPCETHSPKQTWPLPGLLVREWRSHDAWCQASQWGFTRRGSRVDYKTLHLSVIWQWGHAKTDL